MVARSSGTFFFFSIASLSDKSWLSLKILALFASLTEISVLILDTLTSKSLAWELNLSALLVKSLIWAWRASILVFISAISASFLVIVASPLVMPACRATCLFLSYLILFLMEFISAVIVVSLILSFAMLFLIASEFLLIITISLSLPLIWA